MWALIAVGLALVFGVMNIPNFAQGELFMAGTLAAYLIHSSLATSGNAVTSNEWVIVATTLVGAAILGGLLGIVIDLVIFKTLRRRNDQDWMMNSFVLTIGLSIILINIHQLVWGTNYKGIVGYVEGPPIEIVGVPIGRDRVLTLVVAVTATALLGILLRLTDIGRAIRAVAQDEAGARMVGIDINRVHTLTFGLSSALAALAGATLLFMFPSSPYVGVAPLYIAWTVVILAGLGNVGGAIVAGFIVALAQTSTAYYVGGAWQDVIPFGLIIAILVVRPTGLFGSTVRGRWER
jgi:branched-chain amino acid transport system permease protein